MLGHKRGCHGPPCCPAQEVKVKLAQAYGYCWGVERAVQMAYEARKQYPKARVHVTNEIIHNPAVNQVRPALALARLPLPHAHSGHP